MQIRRVKIAKKLIYGVGINDADYVIQPSVGGKQVICPYYRTWISMLSRCYCDTFKSRHPTYTGCSVSEDWITFSNFKRWMETQDWKGKHLDKDILSPNNKVYGEQACIFVTANVNTLLIDCAATRGKLMLGVYWNKQRGKFMAQCKDGNSKSIYLGYYNTELEAHQAWKAYKHSLACKLAEEQTDPRVADALRIRYK